MAFAELHYMVNAFPADRTYQRFRLHVAALRKLLGDEGTGNQYINTVAGRGYCFVAPVARVP
jgi:DNA-binding winged helix-turn-helix (wHTH) protein